MLIPPPSWGEPPQYRHFYAFYIENGKFWNPFTSLRRGHNKSFSLGHHIGGKILQIDVKKHFNSHSQILGGAPSKSSFICILDGKWKILRGLPNTLEGGITQMFLWYIKVEVKYCRFMPRNISIPSQILGEHPQRWWQVSQNLPF